MPNTRSNRKEVEQPIPEVERYIHLKHRIRELIAIFKPMVEADNHPLKDFAVPSQDEPHLSIIPPVIQANTFELKLSLVEILQQNQFSGNPIEDPNLPLSVFVQYADDRKN